LVGNQPRELRFFITILEPCSSWQPSTCGRRSDGGWNCKLHK
jgi:hypothetical protein